MTLRRFCSTASQVNWAWAQEKNNLRPLYSIDDRPKLHAEEVALGLPDIIVILHTNPRANSFFGLGSDRHTTGVTRWQNKKQPNLLKYCKKCRHNSFCSLKGMLLKKPKQFSKYLGNFYTKNVTKNFKKSPNLVALHTTYHFLLHSLAFNSHTQVFFMLQVILFLVKTQRDESRVLTLFHHPMHGALQQKEMKACDRPMDKLIWLLSFIYSLNYLAILYTMAYYYAHTKVSLYKVARTEPKKC